MTDQSEMVADWLTAIGCEPEKNPDSEVRWRLDFNYPTGSDHTMVAVGPPDKPSGIHIVVPTPFAPDHVKAFERLSEAERRQFHLDFRRELNCAETDFRIQGSSGPHDCPESFQVTVTRYEDGLNLDEFAQTVGAAFKKKLDGIWFIQERLANRGLPGGGRFNFETIEA